jgi:hypothetical protein
MVYCSIRGLYLKAIRFEKSWCRVCGGARLFFLKGGEAELRRLIALAGAWERGWWRLALGKEGGARGARYVGSITPKNLHSALPVGLPKKGVDASRDDEILIPKSRGE